MININPSPIGKKKLIGNILYGVAIFLAIIVLIFVIDSEWKIAIILGIVDLFICFCADGQKGVAKRAYRYMECFNSGYMTVEELTKKIGRNEEEVKEDIKDLINDGIILGIYYDDETKEVKEINTNNKKTGNTTKVSTPEVNKRRVCNACGATLNSNDTVCEFCGTKN